MTGSTKSAALVFVGVSLDCADPAKLATFYLGLLSDRVLCGNAERRGCRCRESSSCNAFATTDGPAGSIGNLDRTAVDRLDEPEQQAIALGAELADPQPDARHDQTIAEGLRSDRRPMPIRHSSAADCVDASDAVPAAEPATGTREVCSRTPTRHPDRAVCRSACEPRRCLAARAKTERLPMMPEDWR